jgi:uncharacterized cupredoxin-like copper-binding protein
LTAAAGTVAASLLAAASGCGGSAIMQPPGSTKVTMTDFKFAPAHLDLPAGKTKFYLVNSGTSAHNMVVADPGGTRIAKSELVQAGNAAVFQPQLSAGNYNFFCDEPGHADAGMKGTLTVS